MGSNTPSPTHREPTLPKCPLWAEADVMPVPLIGPLSARSRRTSPHLQFHPTHFQPARKTWSMSAPGVPILALNSRLSDSRSRRLTSRPMFIWISANCLRSCAYTL